MNTKKILFAAALLTVLAACSSNDELSEPMEQRTPVTLQYTTIDAAETRAAQNLNEGTFASGETVKVRISNTGADSWTDYTFTTGDASAMTAPNPAPYYPAGSQNIDIVAYYPATAGTSFSVATDQTTDANYKASDLMFASVTDQAKQADAVNLAFTHKMAKLNVNITAGQGVTSITSVSVLNVKPTVSFNQATGAVGEASGSATTIAMSNNGAAVIPAQTIDGGLLSIVTDKGTATYSVSNKAFAAGYLHTINITVNLRAVGTTTAITGWTSEGTVTVNPVTVAIDMPDISPAGAEAVDLGLSVKWANMNVGATSVTGYGTFFAWGETKGWTDETHYDKESSTFMANNYWWGTADHKYTKYNCDPDTGKDGFVDNKTRLELDNDAARINWGGKWRMPTRAEIQELLDKCTRSWVDNYNNSGRKGVVFTRNDKSIFFPCPGEFQPSISGSRRNNTNHLGVYWSSEIPANESAWPYYLYIYDGNSNSNDIDCETGRRRYYGDQVRAVQE